MNTKTFSDPFAGLPEPDLVRTSIVTSRKIHGALFSVHPQTGVLQSTINILLAKLHEQLERADLTTYNPDVYRHAVANCTIELGNPADVPPAGADVAGPAETPEGNDRQRTKRVVVPDSRPPQPSNAPRPPASAKRGTKTGA